MRAWPLLLLAAAAAPAAAREAPVYQPLGGGAASGYKEKVERDGAWRVTAEGRWGDQISVAMYRAAELVREEGRPFIELSDAIGHTAYGRTSVTLRARGTDVPTRSPACASRGRRCYVADVGELLRRLSGPNGDQPGVAIVDHLDEHGREVTVLGFGLAGSAPARAPFVPVPRAPIVASAPFVPPITRPSPAERRAAAMAAVTPVRGRDRAQGWTIGD